MVARGYRGDAEGVQGGGAESRPFDEGFDHGGAVMEGLRFRAFLLDAAVFGFIGGWIAGMFLGLWAAWTLGGM